MSGTRQGYTAGSIAAEAYVVRPEGTGPHPAVLIAPTVRGPTDAERAHADRLAGQGYLAVVIDVYGERDLAIERARERMNALLADRGELRARLLAAVEFARALGGVDPERLAVIGFCFGGLCALDAARANMPGVRGVASFHGIFAPPGLGEQPPIGAKLLVLHGYDDPLAKPDAMIGLADELTRAGADWQIHAYGHVGHAFTNPAADDREKGLFYDAAADRRAWRAVEDFLREVL